MASGMPPNPTNPAFTVWPSHKLQMIMAVGGAWPRLCASRSTLADVARDALTLRIIQEVNRICVSLRRASDVPRIQEELGCWTACVRRATAEGLFTLAEPARNALVASASRCTARCMDSPELIDSMEGVQQLEWKIVMLVGCAPS
eukprot:TRINITY_DN29131_c0_g1_i1.p1 TRINITY_DN29131_c0_g1~~TRINITY_DN29131_c0_g1_i1.p1  ORF type:complete len:145 (-),score=16.75 TRINITY_DN29131_c0_g1_i1:409-843(-)